MNLLGYARVSTKEQNEDRQVQALLDYGIEKESIFVNLYNIPGFFFS